MFKGWKILTPSRIGEWFRTLLILLGAPILGGVLVWQLMTLDQDKCRTSFEIAKADGAGLISAFQACIGLQSKILDIKDHAIIGLLAVIGLGYLMVMMREARLQGSVNLPGGGGLNLQPMDAGKAADKVAQAAVNEAEDIKDGQGVSQ